jgi:hypothetical protein
MRIALPMRIADERASALCFICFFVALQSITWLAIENGPAIVTDDFPINCHLFCHPGLVRGIRG